MRENVIDKRSGVSAGEYTKLVKGSLDEDDMLSVWDILARATYTFGFEGEEKIEFVRRCLRTLLDAGAIPVVSGGPPWFGYYPTRKFGVEREEIIERVIADWQARGGGDLDWGEYPFTYPDRCVSSEPRD